MAISILLGDVIEIKTYCRLRGQVGINYVHLLSDPNGAAPNMFLEQLVEHIHELITEPFTEVLTVHASYLGLSGQIVRNLTVPPDWFYDSSMVLSERVNAPGIVLGPAQPSQVCGMITKKTDQMGRAFRGRIYVPFPGDNAAEVDGTVTIGYRSDLQLLGDTLMPAVGFEPVGALAPVFPIVFSPSRTEVQQPRITSTLARAKFGTQRGRGDYGAQNEDPW